MQQPHFQTNITIQRNKLTSHEILLQNYKATQVIVNIHIQTCYHITKALYVRHTRHFI